VGERLHWKGPFERSVRPGPRLLGDFLQLVDAPAVKISTYARHWGLIGVCREGMPFSWHRSFNPCAPLGLTRSMLTTAVSKPPREPISVWRFLARQLRGFLNVAAAVREGDVASPRDVQDMRGQGSLALICEADPHHYRPAATPSNREHARAANMFMRQSRALTEIVPLFLWGPVILIHGATCRPGDRLSGLYHALVMQACMAAAQTQGWALCSVGNHPYERGRRTRSGQQNYCPDHRRTAGAAARALEYRQRRREARRLSKKGRSVKEIAAKLGRPVSQVKMWVG
jgi:hypothetical protein